MRKLAAAVAATLTPQSLSRIWPLAGLNKQTLDRVAREASHVHAVSPTNPFIAEGRENDDTAYFVIQGEVTIIVEDAGGNLKSKVVRAKGTELGSAPYVENRGEAIAGNALHPSAIAQSRIPHSFVSGTVKEVGVVLLAIPSAKCRAVVEACGQWDAVATLGRARQNSIAPDMLGMALNSPFIGADALATLSCSAMLSTRVYAPGERIMKLTKSKNPNMKKSVARIVTRGATLSLNLGGESGDDDEFEDDGEPLVVALMNGSAVEEGGDRQVYTAGETFFSPSAMNMLGLNLDQNEDEAEDEDEDEWSDSSESEAAAGFSAAAGGSSR